MTASAILLGLDETPGAPDPAVVDLFREMIARGAPPYDVAEAHDAATIVPALIAVAPDALSRHRRELVPHEVTLASLRDVGRKHRLYGAHTVLPWVLGVMRADVVEVGRLQVERHPGAQGYPLHVPETGPLTPASVDASLRRARALTGSRRFSCTSWLLDPAIAQEMPRSNIAAFAARFEVIGAGEPGAAASEAVCKFVFRRPLDEVLDPRVVEPQSRLERLVAARLRSGARWTEPVGALTV
jgi:hypothetical protein